ncbi:hypothetical protein E8E13_000975 [Curvularia kusanoi]|uniref:Histidine kinase group protein n=1 Tax=Curvularia kusanoi TaxID=90978 RepID=A0A9P4W5W1_CURKU|nr:hypothetical protein E8E13_000975 [Curvularia kusanoi]
MAKKKKSAQAEAGGGDSSAAPANGTRNSSSSKQTGEPSTSALIICRNKHWRYISSFHGPWLQLPPEVLESLAHSNFLSPRPHPIDPAVFYDVLKIRRHVDEATNLAVRAASGLTSAALNNNSSLHGNTMAALGIGVAGGGQLSRERKHRMRELATGKLGAAYRLDEIAASVATMQSASTLEDVAQLVLQRSPGDVDAKYVHFFHEKIPSRMMAQCTPLAVLDDIVAERPMDGSALRTRALTRIFKEDYANSARDLTDALAAARYTAAQHRQRNANPNDQLVLARTQQEQLARDWRSEVKIAEEDQPSSLETQLLFHRAGVYFTIACRHVSAALEGLQEQEEAKAARDAQVAAGEEPTPETPAEAEGRLARAESRKQVRQNAKRALRDYLAFLSHFDYTPGIAPEVAEEFLRRYQNQRPSHNTSQTNGTTDYQTKLDRLLEESSTGGSPVSEALTPYKRPTTHPDRSSWPKLPPPSIYTLNQLFDAVPPASLPAYPPPPNTPSSPLPSNESVTYHPLLPEALHSILLVHSLLQTPSKELLRHAHNAARLVRLLDGYPIFLSARSPARSDWVEILRRGGNWIGLEASWEKLCRPSTTTGGVGPGEANGSSTLNGVVATRSGKGSGATGAGKGKEETKEQRRERIKHEAILEALADERVVDEESFQQAVRAREKRFVEDEEKEAQAEANALTQTSKQTAITNGDGAGEKEKERPESKRWAKDEHKESYAIGTERAEAIARWVRDAPALTAENNTGKKKRRKGVGKKKKKATGLEGVEGRVEALEVEDEEVE